MTGDHVYPGGQVGRDDPRYPTLVRGFNRRWAGDPRHVELCGDAEQVLAAVQRAVDAGLRITVQGGGHCYEDFAVGNDGGVILNLSAMNDVYRDAKTGWYCIEGGATLWDAYTRLYRLYDVTIPGGSCYAVGAGGHIMGGGYGLLSRLHGLTVDVLHGVEVVVVDAAGVAELRTVTRDSDDPDAQLLMWGHLGGGGGNFGVVTKYWFCDPPRAPSEAYLLNLAWEWSDLDEERFAALVGNYGEFLAANSAVGSPFAGMFALLHLGQRVAGQIGLTVQYVGDDPSLLDEFANAMGAGLPAATHQRVPLGYGCEVNAVASGATAVPQRSSIMKLQYQTYWAHPEQDDQNLDWIRAFYEDMYGPGGPLPDDVMDGCYVNYPDVDLSDWQELYYQDGYAKLMQVKRRWDPGNVFHHRQSVQLPDDG